MKKTAVKDGEVKEKEKEKENQKKKEKKENVEDQMKRQYETGNCGAPTNQYDKTCNTLLLKKELLEREELAAHPEENDYLYPALDDPNFIIKIAEKKEFSDTRYDGTIYDIKKQADILANAEFELAPQQAFVRNFLSFQTPYNSLLLYHGLGSGKTCTAIGVCEEQRDYLKQMGMTKKIIIVASPNVQDNFRLQLFDERKLTLVDGQWNIRGCTGNKLLKEINPMNMKGITREKVVSQIKSIIQASYLFVGYVEFANYIAKIKEVKGAFKDETDRQIKMIRNLKYEFDNRLIVIDEIHNIRIAEENKNKKVALQLLDLVKSASNMRLLLLSATPMYNSYKEIIWLLNLMNINDRRATIEVKDVFDKEGQFKKNEQGEEEGKELLIRKATGYVSFIRGENPYTFPFRVYPSIFSPENTLETVAYPTEQMNGKPIQEEDAIRVLRSSIYLTKIGSYQSMGYKFIIDQLKKKKMSISTSKGVIRDMPSFEQMDSFGYTLLQIPIEALNIVYPMDGLEEKSIGPSEGNSEDEVESIEEKAEDNKRMLGMIESPREVDVKRNSSTMSFSIQPNDLTGRRGLERTMNFIDSKNPPQKGQFEYKKGVGLQERMFSPSVIGKYSSKIESICNQIVSPQGNVAEGIILIYSQYIDGGLIPVALALEEMGFTRYGDTNKSLFKVPPVDPVDSKTLQPRIKKQAFTPATYIMITGDPRLSPNNDEDIKAVTNDSNKNGDKIKVVLISQAGSEGVDFKFLRQVHILDPWYNMNRIEQILGRGVRNFSHKDLPFEKRNVELFIYGTLLDDPHEEAADLYIYRVAEYKAIQMGRVTRVLKETAVDCLVHHDQTQFTQENIAALSTEKITQVLSNGTVIKDFKVGDVPFTAACDYMDTCEYKCYPDKRIDEENSREDTYHETFIVMNSDKIVQKIRRLFGDKKDGKFFFKKSDLIRRINYPKSYPLVQIYSALTQMIDNTTEILMDKYGRTGRLINLDEYYLFQPSELNNPHISIYDRSVPLDMKHETIHFEMKTNNKQPGLTLKKAARPTSIEEQTDSKKESDVVKRESEREARKESEREKRKESEREARKEREEEKEEREKEPPVMIEMKDHFQVAMTYARTNAVIERGDGDWYKHCGATMKKCITHNIMSSSSALECLIEHIVDMLLYEEKLELIQYIYALDSFEENTFEYYVKRYVDTKLVRTSRLTSIVLFSGDKIQVMVLKNKDWHVAESEDEREIAMALVSKMDYMKYELNHLIGFIGQDQKNRYLVFKVKDMEAKRNTGARCDEASKGKRVQILTELLGEEGFEAYSGGTTKGMVQPELCSLQELLFRYYQKTKKNNKLWFFDFETAMLSKKELKI